jgi:hypothetical protein
MRLLLWSAALALVLAPQANAVSFNFEEFDATRTGTQAASGGYSSLTSESDGLTMTLRRVRNKTTPGNYNPATDYFNFDLRAFSPAPSGWGSRSLDPTFNLAANPNDDNSWFLATFSQPIGFVSIEMTDFSPYVDTLIVRAFSGIDASGSELGSATACFGTAAECPGRPAGSTGDTPDFALVSLALEEGSFRSILFRASDRLTPNGNLVDNINATPAAIPEPAAFVLTGFSVGAAALSAALRRRS